jgi:hypothetical protein
LSGKQALPQGNGNTESVMKPLGKVIKTSMLEGKNWRQELQRFLLKGNGNIFFYFLV